MIVVFPDHTQLLMFTILTAEKSKPPEVGIEPGPQDLKANTLPRHCESQLLLQGSRSVLRIPIPTTYFPDLN